MSIETIRNVIERNEERIKVIEGFETKNRKKYQLEVKRLNLDNYRLRLNILKLTKEKYASATKT